MIPVFDPLNAGRSHKGLGLSQHSGAWRLHSQGLVGSKSLSQTHCLEGQQMAGLIPSVHQVLECIKCIGGFNVRPLHARFVPMAITSHVLSDVKPASWLMTFTSRAALCLWKKANGV
jgi:hypothetical protein